MIDALDAYMTLTNDIWPNYYYIYMMNSLIGEVHHPESVFALTLIGS